MIDLGSLNGIFSQIPLGFLSFAQQGYFSLYSGKTFSSYPYLSYSPCIPSLCFLYSPIKAFSKTELGYTLLAFIMSISRSQQLSSFPTFLKAAKATSWFRYVIERHFLLNLYMKLLK